MLSHEPRINPSIQERLVLNPRHAAWLVVALWVPYAALNTIFPSPIVTYTLGLLLAACALGMLLLSDESPRTLYLRLVLPSRVGLLILLPMLVFIPGALLAGRGQPFRPLDDLIYAPASALGQELYFRAALLVALARLCARRPRLAVVVQAALFSLWHVRAFLVVATLPALGALLLTFVAGLLWGTQASRDRTILWSVVEHTLFLIVQ
jgi:Type II CAAX prenyl endopeptidase Rce1-like